MNSPGAADEKALALRQLGRVGESGASAFLGAMAETLWTLED